MSPETGDELDWAIRRANARPGPRVCPVCQGRRVHVEDELLYYLVQRYVCFDCWHRWPAYTPHP